MCFPCRGRSCYIKGERAVTLRIRLRINAKRYNLSWASMGEEVKAYILARKSKANVRSIVDLKAQKIHDKQVLEKRHMH